MQTKQNKAKKTGEGMRGMGGRQNKRYAPHWSTQLLMLGITKPHATACVCSTELLRMHLQTSLWLLTTQVLFVVNSCILHLNAFAVPSGFQARYRCWSNQQAKITSGIGFSLSCHLFKVTDVIRFTFAPH